MHQGPGSREFCWVCVLEFAVIRSAAGQRADAFLDQRSAADDIPSDTRRILRIAPEGPRFRKLVVSYFL
jgi:hypothetical protein